MPFFSCFPLLVYHFDMKKMDKQTDRKCTCCPEHSEQARREGWNNEMVGAVEQYCRPSTDETILMIVSWVLMIIVGTACATLILIYILYMMLQDRYGFVFGFFLLLFYLNCISSLLFNVCFSDSNTNNVRSVVKTYRI